MKRLASILALASPLSAQDIWTVDDDGPADFATIQAAVVAAADGDTVLVRAGTYGAVTIDGKGLVIQGEEDPTITVVLFPGPAFQVLNLSGNQAVQVRGLRTFSFGFSEQENLVVENCDGAVIFEDCFFGTNSGEAAVVTDSASVTFVGCALPAAATFVSTVSGTFLAFVPYAGLAAVDSTVFLYDCTVDGGAGVDPGFIMSNLEPGPAGRGVVLLGSDLFASGSVIRGGVGAADVFGGCDPGGAGGTALFLAGGFIEPGSTARLFDTTVTAGLGGTGGCGLPSGADGLDFDVDAGSLVLPIPGNARSFEPVSPVQEGSVLGLRFEGEPGDAILVHFALGAAPGFLFDPLPLALHLSPPFSVIPFGLVPASGALETGFTLPLLPGYEHIVFVNQALFIGQDGFYDGGPRTVMIVSAQL